MLTIEDWLACAVADARKRGLAGLEPLLEALAKATESLRRADDEWQAEQRAAAPADVRRDDRL